MKKVLLFKIIFTIKNLKMKNFLIITEYNYNNSLLIKIKKQIIKRMKNLGKIIKNRK